MYYYYYYDYDYYYYFAVKGPLFLSDLGKMEAD